MEYLKSFKEKVLLAPAGHITVFWVGQAGFIIKTATGKLIGIDLYLSDCVEAVEGSDGYHRLMPRILTPSDLQFDLLIATHFHRDHFDVDAMPELMANGKTKLFCAMDCIDDVENLRIDKSHVSFVKPGDVYDVDGVKLTFIHSDHGTGAPEEIAVIITVDGKRICEVGDTSLHLDWKYEYLQEGPLDVLIAPINGAYGNLNEQENVSLVKVIQPNICIPCHFGMFASHGGSVGLWRELLIKQLPEQCYKIFTQGEGYQLN